MYCADEEVDTEMSKFVDESSKATANCPVERVKWALLEKDDGEYTRLFRGVIDVMTVLKKTLVPPASYHGPSNTFTARSSPTALPRRTAWKQKR